MKRIFSVLVVLILLTGGWYIAWTHVLGRLEMAIADKVHKMENSNAKLYVQTNYVLEPYGFPFKAGFKMDEFSMSMEEKESGDKANLTTMGESHVYVPLSQILNVLLSSAVSYQAQGANIEGLMDVQSEDENVGIHFNIARTFGSGILGEISDYKGTASDVDFYVSMKDIDKQRIVTINSLSIHNIEDDTSALINMENTVEMAGATFFDLRGENSLTMDKFNVALRLEDFPTSPALMDALNALGQSQDERVNIESLKRELANYIVQIAQKNSRFSIENGIVEMGSFKSAFSTNLSVNEDNKLVGQANLSLENLDSFLREKFGQNAALQNNLNSGVTKVEFALESTGEMVTFNGVPVFLAVPSLLDIIDGMPNEVSKNMGDDVAEEILPQTEAEDVIEEIETNTSTVDTTITDMTQQVESISVSSTGAN